MMQTLGWKIKYNTKLRGYALRVLKGEWQLAKENTTKDEKFTSGSCPSAMTGYVRPHTRGELKAVLSAGAACEVASHVAEMTESMLRGWLNFNDFTVRPSENIGWSVFKT